MRQFLTIKTKTNMKKRIGARPDSEPDNDKIINDNGDLELRYDALKHYETRINNNPTTIRFNGDLPRFINSITEPRLVSPANVLSVNNHLSIGESPFAVGSPYTKGINNVLDYRDTALSDIKSLYDIPHQIVEIPDKGLTKKEAEELFKKRGEEIEKKMKEFNKTLQELREVGEKARIAKETTGLTWLEDNISNDNGVEWRCGGCRCPIKTFIGKQGLEDIKKCLEKFKTENGLEPCPNKNQKHLNWFEVKENGILYYYLASFDTVLRPIDKLKKLTEKKTIS